MIDSTAPIFADLTLSLAQAGDGRPALVLHGGGGPGTVAGIAAHLCMSCHAILPTHPGWNGTPRPDWLDSIDDLAMVYLRYLKQQGLSDVLVVGSSIGGWLAAQMAYRDTAGLVSQLVLIDAVGVDIPSHPMTDFFSLDPRGIAEYSYHEPTRFHVDPSSLPPERFALMKGNIATLKLLAGEPYMHDPKLLVRLREIALPTLVLWGESDRIATPAYGAAYAAAFPNARFELIAKAGHLPQIERPDAVFAAIDSFASSV